MPTALSFVTLDVFTEKRFTGNQLAVVEVRDTTLTSESMQTIAREFNFSETVFLHRTDPSQPPRINIFNPVNEMNFAGHPVIGTGHVLFRDLLSHDEPTVESNPEMSVITNAGPVAVSYDAESQIVSAQVPHNVHVHSCVATTQDIIVSQPSFKTVTDVETMRDDHPVVSIVKGVSYVLVDLSKHSSLFSAVSAGPSAKTALDDGWGPSFVGVMYYKILDTQSHHDEARITWNLRVRMIAINLEDPACGSGSCTLAAYLALRFGKPRSAHRFCLDQGAEIGRESKLVVNITLNERGDEISSLMLSGQAVAVTQGQILVD